MRVVGERRIKRGRVTEASVTHEGRRLLLTFRDDLGDILGFVDFDREEAEIIRAVMK